MTVVLFRNNGAAQRLFLSSSFSNYNSRCSDFGNFEHRSSSFGGDFSSLRLGRGFLRGDFLGRSLLGGFGFGFDGACFAGDASLGQSFLAGKVKLTAAAFDDFVQLLTHDG